MKSERSVKMVYVCSGRETRLERGDLIVFDPNEIPIIAFFRPSVNSFMDLIGKNENLIPLPLVKWMIYKFLKGQIEAADNYQKRLNAFSAFVIR